jgi:hypothetical protein
VAATPEEVGILRKVANFLWQTDGNSYHHVWPVNTDRPHLFLGAFFFVN